MDSPHARYGIETDKALLDINVIHAFLRECYWSPGIARSRVERAIANSMCFGAYDRNSARDDSDRAERAHAQLLPSGRVLPRQVGFARVVTDRATYGYICDVFVLDAFRGRGLSKMLMKAIVCHPDLQGLRRLCLMTRDAHGLYAQFGFSAMPEPSRYLEVVDRESYQRDERPGDGH